MKFFKRKKDTDTDWSKYLGKEFVSRKQQLIAYAQKRNIPIHVDDVSENAHGLVSMFRGVVSEAELDKKINEYKKLFWQRVATILGVVVAVSGFLWWLYNFTKK